MIEFVLNDKFVITDEKAGSTLLDFIRYDQNLVGTKIGCREGDCGACTVLIGELIEGKMKYKTLTSCITPLGNAHGKHVVSIEGLNMDSLTPYQQAMVDESGQQCGFCTVGFIVSFAGECLSHFPNTYESIISAIDGNICRCTGYKSIERAAKIIYEELRDKNFEDPISWLIANKYIPTYFKNIPDRLLSIRSSKEGSGLILGGGTDLLVQAHDRVFESEVELVSENKELVGIEKNGGEIHIKAATTTTSFLHAEPIKEIFPNLYKHLKLVSSTPIRNIATIAGNFVNASPIGDLTAYFLALNSDLELKNSKGESRRLKLKDFYKAYKTLNKSKDEYISKVIFSIPGDNFHFNFEKVSKRRYLDIASVNTAIGLTIEDGVVTQVDTSAGGVGPTPKYLEKTCAFLKGKELNNANVNQAAEIMLKEISPISDARGTKEYKSLLLRQLFYAHFIELFPKQFNLEILV